MPRLNLNFLLKLTILFLIVFIQTGQCENIEDRIVRLESIIEDLIMENKNLKKRVEELENTLEFTKLEKIKHYQLIHKHLKETRNKSNNSEDVKELHKDLPVSQGHTKQRLLKRVLFICFIIRPQYVLYFCVILNVFPDLTIWCCTNPMYDNQ